MTLPLKIALCQLNPTVGDVAANAARIVEYAARARAAGADLAVFPELAVAGYPPLDLLERDDFIDALEAAREKIVGASAGIGILFGTVERAAGHGRPLRNSAWLVRDGHVVGRARKALLPSYDVFEEDRFFRPAGPDEIAPIDFDGLKLGVAICEDGWNDETYFPKRRRYALDPVRVLAEKGAALLINISASPFDVRKSRSRYAMFAHAAARHGLPYAVVNQVGGNDGLVFDGGSFAVDRDGNLLARAACFAEEMTVVDFARAKPIDRPAPDPDIRLIHDALTLGLGDYVRKCGFRRVLVGLSGGIDSAVTAGIAASALGGENVLGVAMPGPYSSPDSLADAQRLAQNAGLEFRVVGIEPGFRAAHAMLDDVLGAEPGIAFENVQARLRGMCLMAISNSENRLLLTTGNKSEVSVGYCTLYGDTCGGLAVISDVFKTDVYRLAEYINREREVIPPNTIVRPPTAELAPGQLDTDSLPVYDLLDKILRLYVEENLPPAQIAAAGFDAELVARIVGMVDRSEYKRRQLPPGLKISVKAFGSGRRIPIAQRWRSGK